MKLTLNTASLPPSLRQIVEEAYGKKEKTNRSMALISGLTSYADTAGELFGVDIPDRTQAIVVLKNDLLAFLMSGVVVRDRKDKAQE